MYEHKYLKYKHKYLQNMKGGSCKKFRLTISPKCNDQSGCYWVTGKGCLSKPNSQSKEKKVIEQEKDQKGDNKLYLMDYKKCLAVYGSTKENYSLLKNLKGKWNSNLSVKNIDGCCWIFGGKRKEEIIGELRNNNVEFSIIDDTSGIIIEEQKKDPK